VAVEDMAVENQTPEPGGPLLGSSKLRATCVTPDDRAELNSAGLCRFVPRGFHPSWCLPLPSILNPFAI